MKKYDILIESCFSGGTGRRVRLKIVYPKDVRVRFPSGAPLDDNSNPSSFNKKRTCKKFFFVLSCIRVKKNS